MDLSTVGGWLACRGAGQYSTRYGKIEDMVLGLEVVLADGRVVHTEGHGPRAATGPNLTQLFVGSEGTLGVITEARFRIHPVPAGAGAAGLRLRHLRRRASTACRRILRRGATPAVLRLYDADRVGTQLRPGRHQRPHRAGRGRPGTPGGHAGRRRRRVRAAAGARRWTRRWSSAGWATATTSRPWPRCGGRASWWTRRRSSARGPRCPGSSTR